MRGSISSAVVNNGFIHDGKQNHRCKDCGRQFVENPENQIISSESKGLIGKLLLEKIPLADIARVVEVSEPWLQDCVNKKYESVPREVKVGSKKRGRLTLQCDEAWSFVGNKGNKQWIWLAIDEEIHELVGVYD